MRVQTPYQIKKWKGIDNTSDAVRVDIQRGSAYCTIAENVDIDDEGMLHSRCGRSLIVPGASHSMWAEEGYCLFVQGPNLYRMKTDETTEILLAGYFGDGDPLAYVFANQYVYFANNSVIGFVKDNVASAFAEPNQEFMERMVGGHLLEWYASSLFAAQDNKIFFSEANWPSTRDGRKSFYQFNGRVTMMKAVIDGLYVSADASYFMAGKDPEALTMARVTDSKAIEGCSVKVDGEDIGQGKGIGTVVMWIGENDGVYVGLPGGIVKEITPMYACPDYVQKGKAIVSYLNGFGQYLSVCQMKENYGSGNIDIKLQPLEAELD